MQLSTSKFFNHVSTFTGEKKSSFSFCRSDYGVFLSPHAQFVALCVEKKNTSLTIESHNTAVSSGVQAGLTIVTLHLLATSSSTAY